MKISSAISGIKAVALVSLAAFLSSCATAPVMAPVPVTSKGVVAFRNICLSQAPGYSRSTAIGAKYGIKTIVRFMGATSGSNADRSLRLIASPKKFCVINMPHSSSMTTRAEFLTLVSNATGIPISSLSSKTHTKYKGVNTLFEYRTNSKGRDLIIMSFPGR